MKPKRPINRDVPAPEDPAPAEPKKAEEPPKPAEPENEREPKEPPAPGKHREPKPLAPKLLAALVVLALVFIVVAIVGSSGGDDKAGTTSAAPASAPAAAGQGDEGSSSAQAPEALGYPGTATNNTTRIGDSDPTSNAAAVSLAVFPSTTPAQRPAAVTLVDEKDWAGALAAAVLMAEPVRAPVLFSAPGELPEATAQALEALDPQGSKATGGASYFAIGSVALPDGAGKVTRVDSGDPAATAAQIATLRERLTGEEPKQIMVAPTEFPEYAMAAAAYAARSGYPILFTDTKKLSQPTVAFLKRHPKANAHVIGPSEVVSLRDIGEVGDLVNEVSRITGPGPGDTALALAHDRTFGFGWGVSDPGHGFVIVDNDSPDNAAAAAPLSASGTWAPLLLTKEPDTLPAKVRSYLLDVKPGYTNDPTRAFYNHVWLIGDQEEISVQQQAEVNELAELTKIGGGE
ncbi:MAG TPA: cell wall-binding repeat-containing protein [Solirubrobacterales bacterium]|nr:cell wall-binding repeat-containing protein [Solirubrobacterales bacterium]